MEKNILDPCFICNLDCKPSQLFLETLTTQKNKTPYLKLISELINNNYELHVTSSNKICLQCQLVCERYDELMQESRKVKAVLSRQMATTYALETDEYFYIDTARVFNKTSVGPNNVQFTCRICRDFITMCPSTADKHFVYHEILESREKKLENVQEFQRRENESAVQQQQSSSTSVRTYTNKKLLQPTFEDKIMKQLIDIEQLEDPFSESNVRLGRCVMTNCPEEFLYLCDYVHHLKFNHKASLNQIFTIIRANIKKPKTITKLCCPFCYTKTNSESSLIEHVKLHEDSTTNVFAEKLNTFISNLISQSKCKTCGFERSDSSQENCYHEKVKDKENSKLNCKHCDAFFFRKILLNNHLADEHSECFACNTMHKQRFTLTKHLNLHVSQTEQKCPFNCKNILKTKKSLQDHVKYKHPENCCKYCNDWFMEGNSLSQHVRYSHANLRTEEEPSICDHCGLSYKNSSLLKEHVVSSHPNPRMFLCSICKKSTFKFRYNLFEHMSTDHQRKIVDNDDTFYKCFCCPKTFTSCDRSNLLAHIKEHSLETSFCTDCNSLFESLEELETHRAKVHLDFSVLINKLDPLKVFEIQEAEQLKANPPSMATRPTVPNTSAVMAREHEMNGDSQEHYQQQPLLIQNEDGSILNNLLINENGELIVQNYDSLLQNGHELGESSQLQQIEQFLLEQGITDTSGISYIQTEDGQILLQTDDSHIDQEALMQMLQQSQDDVSEHQNSEVEVEVDVPSVTINPENQAALDELGDILLEVAAAADNDKSSKSSSSRMIPSIKRKRENAQNGKMFKEEPQQKRNVRMEEEENQPVKNFSQAYEYFVKGFDAMRNKI